MTPEEMRGMVEISQLLSAVDSIRSIKIWAHHGRLMPRPETTIDDDLPWYPTGRWTLRKDAGQIGCLLA